MLAQYRLLFLIEIRNFTYYPAFDYLRKCLYFVHVHPSTKSIYEGAKL